MMRVGQPLRWGAYSYRVIAMDHLFYNDGYWTNHSPYSGSEKRTSSVGHSGGTRPPGYDLSGSDAETGMNYVLDDGSVHGQRGIIGTVLTLFVDELKFSNNNRNYLPKESRD
jgi:hypothetical protein